MTVGDFDPSFGGGDGLVTADFGGRWDEVFDLAVQPDGKIVAAGRTTKDQSAFDGKTGDFALARYNADGTLDTTFGSGGKVQTAVNSGKTDFAWSVAVQGNGKIVAVGQNLGGNDFAIVRHNANGTLDTSFDKDGKLATDFGGTDYAKEVAIDPTGDGNRFIVAGLSNNQIVLARYRSSDGKLDTTFNGDGKAFSGLTSSGRLSMAVNNTGIYVSYVADGAAKLSKFNFNGVLDASFGAGGVATGPNGTRGDLGLLLQADGKVLVYGNASVPYETASLMVRFDANGSVDPTFDGDGVLTLADPEYRVSIRSAGLQADGKVWAIIENYWDGLTNPLPGLVRLNVDGSFDSTFDSDGVRVYSYLPTASMIVEPSGNLLLGGSVKATNTPPDFSVGRLLGEPPASAISATETSENEFDSALMFFLMEDTTSLPRRK